MGEAKRKRDTYPMPDNAPIWMRLYAYAYYFSSAITPNRLSNHYSSRAVFLWGLYFTFLPVFFIIDIIPHLTQIMHPIVFVVLAMSGCSIAFYYKSKHEVLFEDYENVELSIWEKALSVVYHIAPFLFIYWTLSHKAGA